MTSPADALVTIDLPARLWSCVDANIDNVVSLAVVDGPESDVETGDVIRDAGSAQVPWVDGQWPPMNQEIAISLAESQWRWALHHVEDHLASYERIGDQESLELGQAAAAAIRHGLGEQPN